MCSLKIDLAVATFSHTKLESEEFETTLKAKYNRWMLIMNNSDDRLEGYKQRANFFIDYFSRHLNDPTQRDWKTGLRIAQRWLTMLEGSDTPTLEDAEVLLAETETYLPTGSVAVDMHLGISGWYNYVRETR